VPAASQSLPWQYILSVSPAAFSNPRVSPQSVASMFLNFKTQEDK